MNRFSIVTVVALALALSACNSSNSPTGPGGSSYGASIAGHVTLGAASKGMGLADAMTVKVDGTSISTTVGADGRFQLTGVPAGDRDLLFASSSSIARLHLDAVGDGESIELDVTVGGGQVTVNSESRRGGDLRLALDPDKWNVSWAGSGGTTTAFLYGTGYDQVDVGSITLGGDDASVAPIAPANATREGVHVKAQFSKAQAIALFGAHPTAGSVHTVTIRFTVAGVWKSLTDQVTVIAS